MGINRNSYFLALVAVCMVSCTAVSQSAPSQATHDEIDYWLRSGQPRMIAWGATFAAKSMDVNEVPTLKYLAERYEPVPPRTYNAGGSYVPRTAEQKQQLDSMQAVLDALIQMHGYLSYEGVSAILPDFPAQALILFASMPEPERSRKALLIYDGRDRTDQPYTSQRFAQQQMIHLAAAILALHPPPGFTATLLRETTITLKVAVADDDQERDGTFSASCGDSFGLTPALGWPQPYTYVVEEFWPGQGATEDILVPGVPSLTSRRALSNSSCSTLSGFTSVQKLGLARQEAGLHARGASVGTLQYDTLYYTGSADFGASLAAVVARHEQPLRELMEVLAGKSFLTASEVGDAVPAFAVEIDDQRKDKSQLLSIPRSLGANITVRPYNAESGRLLTQQ